MAGIRDVLPAEGEKEVRPLHHDEETEMSISISVAYVAEIERLRHDADRYQQCMRDLAGEIERLNSLLRRCADTIDCLRDYVVEGGSIRMVGARQSIDDADALLAAMAGVEHD